MPRKKLITTEELLRLADLYCAENPGTKIKVTEFTGYIKQHGYPQVNAYLVRRNHEFMAYMERINDEYKKRQMPVIPVYRNLNLDDIFADGRSTEEIREMLKKRDDYYCELAKSTAIVFKQNQELNSEIAAKDKTIEELNSCLESQKNADEEIRRLKKELSSCRELAKKLKNIVETNVQPEIANALLARDGILKRDLEILKEDSLDGIIDAESRIDSDNSPADDVDSLKESMLSAFDD